MTNLSDTLKHKNTYIFMFIIEMIFVIKIKAMFPKGYC